MGTACRSTRSPASPTPQTTSRAADRRPRAASAARCAAAPRLFASNASCAAAWAGRDALETAGAAPSGQLSAFSLQPHRLLALKRPRRAEPSSGRTPGRSRPRPSLTWVGPKMQTADRRPIYSAGAGVEGSRPFGLRALRQSGLNSRCSTTMPLQLTSVASERGGVPDCRRVSVVAGPRERRESALWRPNVN
jgi:hypothetical protein